MAAIHNKALQTDNFNTESSKAVSEKGSDISFTKISLNTSYSIGDTITYLLSVINSGSVIFNDVSITDNLGAYYFGTKKLHPLSYVDSSAVLCVNGKSEPINVKCTKANLVFSGFSLPANSGAIISYRTKANFFAPLKEKSTIKNKATLEATKLPSPVTATATIPVLLRPILFTAKTLSYESSTENRQLTRTITLFNIGSKDVREGVFVNDTLNPTPSDIRVTCNGTLWTAGINYTFDKATGIFTTLEGQLTVPKATFTQNATTGKWTVTPGSTKIRITSTV